MDFILKKIISIFIMPFPLGMFLFILAFIFLYKNMFTKAKITFVLSFIWLFFISYSPLVDTLLYRYENTFPALLKAPENIKYIYVLGGGHHTDETRPITSQVAESSVVRVNEGIRLYRQFNKKPIIIFSGYNGFNDPSSGASMQKKLAVSLGMNKHDIHLEPTPRDTQEEAQAAKRVIGNAPFILVTSASHMKRAMKFFNHEGLFPVPAPTNYLANIKHPDYFGGFFSTTALRKSNILWHEILGLIWQKIKGI